MTYSCGKFCISVRQLDGFGENPSLWIGVNKPHQMVKVASFGSTDEADMFCKWLDWFFDLSEIEPELVVKRE